MIDGTPKRGLGVEAASGSFAGKELPTDKYLNFLLPEGLILKGRVVALRGGETKVVIVKTDDGKEFEFPSGAIEKRTDGVYTVDYLEPKKNEERDLENPEMHEITLKSVRWALSLPKGDKKREKTLEFLTGWGIIPGKGTTREIIVIPDRGNKYVAEVSTDEDTFGKIIRVVDDIILDTELLDDEDDQKGVVPPPLPNLKK